MLEFRYDLGGLVMDGSPLTGTYKRGDWWLDGQKLESGDVLDWTTDGATVKATVWARDYGYVLLAVLVVEENDEGDADAWDHELTLKDVGQLELRFSSRWWDSMTAEDHRVLLREIEKDLAIERGRVKRYEAEPHLMPDEWADIRAINQVRNHEYWQRRHNDRLKELGAVS